MALILICLEFWKQNLDLKFRLYILQYTTSLSQALNKSIKNARSVETSVNIKTALIANNKRVSEKGSKLFKIIWWFLL